MRVWRINVLGEKKEEKNIVLLHIIPAIKLKEILIGR